MARVYKGFVHIKDEVLNGEYGVVDFEELDRINDEADECLKFIGIHSAMYNGGLCAEKRNCAVFTGKAQGILCVLID